MINQQDYDRKVNLLVYVMMTLQITYFDPRHTAWKEFLSNTNYMTINQPYQNKY